MDVDRHAEADDWFCLVFSYSELSFPWVPISADDGFLCFVQILRDELWAVTTMHAAMFALGSTVQ
jgi:hypothetical protein